MKKTSYLALPLAMVLAGCMNQDAGADASKPVVDTGKTVQQNPLIPETVREKATENATAASARGKAAAEWAKKQGK